MCSQNDRIAILKTPYFADSTDTTTTDTTTVSSLEGLSLDVGRVAARKLMKTITLTILGQYQ